MTEEQSDKKTCFVVGPIGASGSSTRTHADWLLKAIIAPVFSQHFKDFSIPIRSDTIADPGMIDSQMIGLLLDADIVIADMSELNANAFYEMGIRHMAQKPIIHMFLRGTNIPFDVKPYRGIEFSREQFDDIGDAQLALKAAVEAALKPGFQVENPVTKARGAVKLKEHATPEMKLIWDELADIRQALSARSVESSWATDRGKFIVHVDFGKIPSDLPDAETIRKAQLVRANEIRRASFANSARFNSGHDSSFLVTNETSHQNMLNFVSDIKSLGGTVTIEGNEPNLIPNALSRGGAFS